MPRTEKNIFKDLIYYLAIYLDCHFSSDGHGRFAGHVTCDHYLRWHGAIHCALFLNGLISESKLDI